MKSQFTFTKLPLTFFNSLEMLPYKAVKTIYLKIPGLCLCLPTSFVKKMEHVYCLCLVGFDL